MRIPFSALALALLAMPALAASPEVEAAIKTIRAVATDPDQLKTFCALLQMEKVGEGEGDKKDDPKIEAAIDEYFKRLGTEFQSAWEVVESIDENSPDGKAIDAVLDELDDKCR
jgi:hypothetical protein